MPLAELAVEGDEEEVVTAAVAAVVSVTDGSAVVVQGGSSGARDAAAAAATAAAATAASVCSFPPLIEAMKDNPKMMEIKHVRASTQRAWLGGRRDGGAGGVSLRQNHKPQPQTVTERRLTYSCAPKAAVHGHPVAREERVGAVVAARSSL